MARTTNSKLRAIGTGAAKAKASPHTTTLRAVLDTLPARKPVLSATRSAPHAQWAEGMTVIEDALIDVESATPSVPLVPSVGSRWQAPTAGLAAAAAGKQDVALCLAVPESQSPFSLCRAHCSNPRSRDCDICMDEKLHPACKRRNHCHDLSSLPF